MIALLLKGGVTPHTHAEKGLLAINRAHNEPQKFKPKDEDLENVLCWLQEHYPLSGVTFTKSFASEIARVISRYVDSRDFFMDFVSRSEHSPKRKELIRATLQNDLFFQRALMPYLTNTQQQTLLFSLGQAGFASDALSEGSNNALVIPGEEEEEDLTLSDFGVF